MKTNEITKKCTVKMQSRQDDKKKETHFQRRKEKKTTESVSKDIMNLY